MDENTAKVSPEDDNNVVPESPKPLAFTIEFESPKAVDTLKHRNLLEKLQNRHRRGQSLSKLEEPQPAAGVKKHPLSGNLPRKSSFQSEGYFSSDEKSDKSKNVRTASLKLKSELTLPLKHTTTDKMTQSFPNRSFNLPSIESPEVELKDVSSPEMELVSPVSPIINQEKEPPVRTCKKVVRQYSSPECESEPFVDGTEFDFDKSDTVSDAGTYTLDADNYTEEQKARMSIDKDFKLEQVSFMRKTEEYIQSLTTVTEQKAKQQTKQRKSIESVPIVPRQAKLKRTNGKPLRKLSLTDETTPRQLPPIQRQRKGNVEIGMRKLSLTENTKFLIEQHRQTPQALRESSSFMENASALDERPRPFAQQHKQKRPNIDTTSQQKRAIIDTALKEMSSSETTPIDRSPSSSLGSSDEQSRSSSKSKHFSLTQSTTVTDEQPKQMNNGEGDINDIVNKTFTKIMFPSSKAKIGVGSEQELDQGCFTSVTSSGVFSRRAQNMRHVRKSSLVHSEIHVEAYTDDCHRNGHQFGDDEKELMSAERVTNLPPAVGGFGGKMSPTKIPSPIHSLRPRSRNSVVDLSDSSLETESYLKPTQNYIHTLQTRLSLDSDSDCDINNKYPRVPLNNDTRNLLKQKQRHVRHNSFDDRNITISNKLDHFQTKNLQQNIDQTFTNKNQYYQNKVVHRIQNSPNDSPVKRSSSFSTKNQLEAKTINTLLQKETNLRNSPNFTRTGSIQRSSSTASIKPNHMHLRRASISSENQRIDRTQYADTESSSEEDFDKALQANKKDYTATRYNRAFSLRRGRLDEPAVLAGPPPKCPNTPEMKRKFMTTERGTSVDRKVKSADIHSRYLNISKTSVKASLPVRVEPPKSAPVKCSASKNQQVFSRTDSGRFSMKSSKPAASTQKVVRKDGQGKKQSGPRSNSTLSSREVEFQNWKRRKTYDPMKAAAEGKRKAEIARKQNQSNNVMVQSYNEMQEYDSSPSHSGSVHRSQSFHGTAALDQLISSEDEDLTLSADEGFSPPTPSPCEMSPSRNRQWRHM